MQLEQAEELLLYLPSPHQFVSGTGGGGGAGVESWDEQSEREACRDLSSSTMCCGCGQASG